jgi:hypothetical protein
MSERSPSHRTAWAPGDTLLTLGGTLLFVDSFLHWEQICVSVVRVSPICVDFWTAWSGRGAFAGAGMAIASAGLAVWQTALALSAAGAAPPWMASAVEGQHERQRGAISVGIATGCVVLGVVKLAFVVADHSTYGSYVAPPLLLLIAAGAAMKGREAKRQRR